MSNVVTHPRAEGDAKRLLIDLANGKDITAVALCWVDGQGVKHCCFSSMPRSQLLAMAAWLQFDAIHETIKDQDA